LLLQALREYHSPLQLRKRIGKKCSGLQTAVHCSSLRIKENLRCVSINASARVQHVTRWAFTLNFTKIFLPLAIIAFLTLLHPHTEIQLGVIAGIVFFVFAFALATRSLVPHTITEKTSSQECLKNAPALPSTSFLFLLYQQMPLAMASMLWGLITSLHLPANLNYISILLFANVTGCNVEEALEQDLSKYETLSQFFTRRLRAGVRPISTTSALVSPSDGKLTYSGPVEGEYLQQVKGVRYSLATFLGPNVPNWPKSETTSLYQAVVYLSPSDYHRFHSPADWSISHRRHFPGALCSVQPSVVAAFPGLFHTNERVAFFGTWKHGFMAMVAVGATNVGSIVADFDPELKTNHLGKTPEYEHEVEYGTPISFKKGDDVGFFNFGSTMVVIFEAPSDLDLRPSETVKMGQPLLV
jgi:phosphatidylserine decarboxylase